MQRELGVNGRAKNSARRPCRLHLPADRPVLSRGSTHAIPTIDANGALTSVQVIDQSTQPETAQNRRECVQDATAR
jgi:hypothetical protein